MTSEKPRYPGTIDLDAERRKRLEAQQQAMPEGAEADLEEEEGGEEDVEMASALEYFEGLTVEWEKNEQSVVRDYADLMGYDYENDWFKVDEHWQKDVEEEEARLEKLPDVELLVLLKDFEEGGGPADIEWATALALGNVLRDRFKE